MRRVMIGMVVIAAGACRTADAPPAAEPTSAKPGAALADWTPPPESAIPDDSMGVSVRRGLALLRHTPDSLPRYATSNLRCVSCHLDDGRRVSAAPLAGAHARYPKYMARTGAVVNLTDRVNYCFTRSLAGNALPDQSREMQDILAYIAWLSTGVPVGTKVAGAEGLLKLPSDAVGDSARGHALFETTCAQCHGSDGAGKLPPAPALWGAKSYSIGASMAREERAASFIQHNMPLTAPGSLTVQQAYDLSAYINAHPRPDSPGKRADYPAGDAAADTPYDTKGHTAYRAPARLLPRANPRGATVNAPARAADGGVR
ncbi:MAG: c-type cytochrome [Gemmatimonadaceae bacterium]|nr:c-type cytochrome [Gemmatimonadaceae bacterium]